MRRAIFPPLLALITLPATPAFADKMSETLDISLGPRGSWVELDQPMKVAPAVDGPAVIADAEPTLTGTGQLWGGVGRIGASLDGWRLGVGVGFVGAAHLSLHHTPLPDGLSIEPGNLWGEVFEGYLGYGIGNPRTVQLILDVRGGVTILQSALTLNDPSLGSLGSTPWNAYLPNLDLRLGVRIDVEDFFVETGVAVSPLPEEYVPERGSIFAALGVPIPFDNL